MCAFADAFGISIDLNSISSSKSFINPRASKISSPFSTQIVACCSIDLFRTTFEDSPRLIDSHVSLVDIEVNFY